MKYNEAYCIQLMEKVLLDVKRQRGEEYYDKGTPFEALFYENDKNLFDGSIIKNCWRVYVKVPKDGWKGGNIIVKIDDDTGKALTFANSALGGRPITFLLEIDDEGNYYIPKEYLPE